MIKKQTQNNPKQKNKNDKSYLLYGKHAINAALNNPLRRIDCIYANENSINNEISNIAKQRSIPIRTLDKIALNKIISTNANHQNIALKTYPLPAPTLSQLLKNLQAQNNATIIIADRIADPQNIGAMLRTMSAFASDAIILPTHYAASEKGALAKAAAGALENIHIIYATNLNQAINSIKQCGFWCYALNPPKINTENQQTLNSCQFASHSTIVLGSEGKGIRPLVLENCDTQLYIPMHSKQTQSLNVSAATAVVLNHRYQQIINSQ